MNTIVFYSYKGGTGRSLLLANYAQYLSLCGRRVFILDCDLEAPGLHHKFAASEVFSAKSPGANRLGLVDYIPKRTGGASELPLQITVPETLDQYVIELEVKGGREPVFFMPAGNAPEPSYAQSVLSIEWKQLFPPWNPLDPKPATGVPLFGDLQERIAETYKPHFLLIDSRTGITDIGSVVVQHLADSFVCVFLNNPENIAGTKAIIQSLRGHRDIPLAKPLKIVPVFARVTEASRREEQESVRSVKAALGDALDGPLYLLHEEQSLHVAEELLLGNNDRALGDSTLLRDYLHLFRALDPETAAQSRYASLHSYLKRVDELPSSHHSDGNRPAVEILEEIKKRNPKVVLHAGAYAACASESEYSGVGYRYVAGSEYGSFAANVLRNLLKQTHARFPDLQSNEKVVKELEINWDLLSVQVGVLFDFSSEPYYLTQFRSLFLDVVPFGQVKTFTCFILSDSDLHRSIASTAKPGEIGAAVQRATEKDPGIECCLMGESAAADEAARAIHPFIHGSSLNFRRDAEGLKHWLEDSSSDRVAIERRLIICDHSVAGKLRDTVSNPERYIFSRNRSEKPNLVFNCREDIPTGFLYPAGDRRWRYFINKAVAASVNEQVWGSSDLPGTVAGNLRGSGIEPFSWDELKASIVLGMNPDDAQDWLNLVGSREFSTSPS